MSIEAKQFDFLLGNKYTDLKKIKFKISGTNNIKDIYLDPYKNVKAALDSESFYIYEQSNVVYGEGVYDIDLYDSDSNIIDTITNYTLNGQNEFSGYIVGDQASLKSNNLTIQGSTTTAINTEIDEVNFNFETQNDKDTYAQIKSDGIRVIDTENSNLEESKVIFSKNNKLELGSISKSNDMHITSLTNYTSNQSFLSGQTSYAYANDKLGTLKFSGDCAVGFEDEPNDIEYDNHGIYIDSNKDPKINGNHGLMLNLSEPGNLSGTGVFVFTLTTRKAQSTRRATVGYSRENPFRMVVHRRVLFDFDNNQILDHKTGVNIPTRPNPITVNDPSVLTHQTRTYLDLCTFQQAVGGADLLLMTGLFTMSVFANHTVLDYITDSHGHFHYIAPISGTIGV